MEIRAAAVLDAQAIAEIHVAAWRSAYRGIVPEQHLEALCAEKRKAYWSSAITAGEPWVHVAEGADGVVGWIAFGRSRDSGAPEEIAEIWSIHVSPPVWNRGIGGRLMAACYAELRRRGFAGVTLWVLSANERARRFYAGEGFVAEQETLKDVSVGGAALPQVRHARALHDVTSGAVPAIS